ncbi:MAG: acetylglutamate kinase [Bacteroidales bacterium]|jgi:acetylglutamate kinase|nr:acetylglutamate kinase [Bacteroidales bacterium]
MKQLTVIKIGGNIVDKPAALEEFLKKFSKESGPKVLIHGGGVMATELSAKMGLQVNMQNGRRVTDLDTLKLVTMVYAGWINKSIVGLLQKFGTNAIGLSGADGDVVPATRRSPYPVDFGYVGDVNPVDINIALLESLLGRGITPVFCAITHDRNGSLLNTNADTMASSLAIALSKDYSTRLIYCFEKEGVLSNPEDEDSVIPLITKNSYEILKETKAVSGGMLPKLDNAFSAIESGVAEVCIKHALNLGNNKGTVLKL